MEVMFVFGVVSAFQGEDTFVDFDESFGVSDEEEREDADCFAEVGHGREPLVALAQMRKRATSVNLRCRLQRMEQRMFAYAMLRCMRLARALGQAETRKMKEYALARGIPWFTMLPVLERAFAVRDKLAVLYQAMDAQLKRCSEMQETVLRYAALGASPATVCNRLGLEADVFSDIMRAGLSRLSRGLEGDGWTRGRVQLAYADCAPVTDRAVYFSGLPCWPMWR
ncbi:MAG: hypothetical protein LBM78_02460 [Clostridiales bacterium]|jgi:hypothetical protein|nr:hypothetical protein [Clostridiales bacterium]